MARAGRVGGHTVHWRRARRSCRRPRRHLAGFERERLGYHLGAAPLGCDREHGGFGLGIDRWWQFRGRLERDDWRQLRGDRRHRSDRQHRCRQWLGGRGRGRFLGQYGPRQFGSRQLGQQWEQRRRCESARRGAGATATAGAGSGSAGAKTGTGASAGAKSGSGAGSATGAGAGTGSGAAATSTSLPSGATTSLP